MFKSKHTILKLSITLLLATQFAALQAMEEATANDATTTTTIDKAERERLNKELILACKNGDTDTAIALIDEGADINSEDIYGFSPLHFACADIETTRSLVKHGATIRQENIYLTMFPTIQEYLETAFAFQQDDNKLQFILEKIRKGHSQAQEIILLAFWKSLEESLDFKKSLFDYQKLLLSQLRDIARKDEDIKNTLLETFQLEEHETLLFNEDCHVQFVEHVIKNCFPLMQCKLATYKNFFEDLEERIDFAASDEIIPEESSVKITIEDRTSLVSAEPTTIKVPGAFLLRLI